MHPDKKSQNTENGQCSQATPNASKVSGGVTWPNFRELLEYRLERLRREQAEIIALLKALPVELPEQANIALCSIISRSNR